jgi:NTP pyrophosphatase (non-canonical NTP hydrolase)
MSDDLGLRAVREANLRRVRETWRHEQEWSPSDWMTCVLGELGEAANILKVEMRDHNRSAPKDAAALADELADTLLYLDLLAARCGIDLAAAVRAKFDRTSLRVGSRVFLGGDHAETRP